MKALILTALVSLVATSGCIVRTRGRGGGYARSCPPAHHWEDGACVHNGNGRPHVRDHR
jgi:hypothetical protein